MREAYLDGLRGWAAIAVVLHHLLHVTISPDWREHLPFIPFFADGTFAVFVFFVLSGYVLSAGFFRTGERSLVVDLALRRYFRLTIPILAISAIAAAMMAAVWMVNEQAGYAAGSRQWWPLFYQFDPIVSDVMSFTLYRVYFDPNPITSYNSSLWTMPVEMQGSFAVFALLLIAGSTRTYRLLAHIILLGITWWIGSSIFAMALGCALADARNHALFQRLKSSTARSAISSALILGALIAAAIRSDDNSPWILSFASLALVVGVMLNSRVRKALETRASQWVGRLSFSIYLVQILVICSFTAWGFVALFHGHSVSAGGLLALFVSSLGIILLGAMIFHPFERLGIMVGRKFSQMVFRLSRAGSSSISTN